MPAKHSLKDAHKVIAMERVDRLFELAEGVFKRHPELADRYIKLAWKIKTRYNIRLPPELKRRFCRKCQSFWKPGVSCRVRINQGRIITTCLRCGHVARLPLKPKKTLSWRTHYLGS
jgi:ribonuclease P protein subunit RPR2